jgi:TrbC/VIRB2 pilin
VAFPELASAQTVTGGASPATMINNICTFILGPFGQSLAVLGIIAIGLSWMFGRVSLGLIAGVIGGIIIMFGDLLHLFPAASDDPGKPVSVRRRGQTAQTGSFRKNPVRHHHARNGC